MRRPLATPEGADEPLGPGAKIALACEVLGAYVRARRALRHADVRAALAALRSTPAPRSPSRFEDPVRVGRRLARVTVRTLAVMPADSRCLVQALTLTVLLARRGITSDLVVSVRPAGGFGAHAWLEHQRVPLLPPSAPGYETLTTL